MDLKLLSAIGAAGAAGGDPIGVEDVFKTYVYTGTGSALTINNGIDLSGEGGMVWAKDRSDGQDQQIVDTVRGDDKYIFPNMTNAESTVEGNGSTVGRVNSFNNNGFTLQPTQYDGTWNKSGDDYVSYTFKKQKKFFTICTWTGNGTQNHEISHDLASVPGCIMIKNLSNTENWVVYHRKTQASYPEQAALVLNGTGAKYSSQGDFNYYAPTDEHFRLGADSQASNTNENGDNYVAYLFAHEEAEFGPNSDQSIISCGSYTGTGSAGLSVTLPFEPQFLLIKNATEDSTNWRLYDTMRGIVSGGNDNEFIPDKNWAETTTEDRLEITPTGFKVVTTGNNWNASGSNYIYIAIAAETGITINSKNITAGTDVFAMDTGSSSSTIPTFDSGFAPDMGLIKVFASATGWDLSTRLTQGKYLRTHDTDAEAAYSHYQFDSNVGWADTLDSTHISYMWKRFAGFDCITYDGTGSARTIAHNLGPNNVPEMIWVKRRDSARTWGVYHKGLNGGTNPEQYAIYLDSNAAESGSTQWNETAPTATHFSLGTSTTSNNSSGSYIAMLFSSVEGISSVGSYSGSDSDQFISLGFQPRFFLCKCYNLGGTGQSWNVFDSLRGISGASTKRIWLDLEDAQGSGSYVTSVSSTGITLAGGYSHSNASDRNYIYYAHA